MSLIHFLSVYNLKYYHIYKNHTFNTLKAEAWNRQYHNYNEKRYQSMFKHKWDVTESYSYFSFILSLIKQDFQLSKLPATRENQLFALMLYYDFYQVENQGDSLEKAIIDIGSNPDYVNEMCEILEYKISKIDFEEIPYLNPNLAIPLRIHARYTREQILVALGMSTYEKQSSNREGVAENKDLNLEALFINLQKTEADFSPTTMYDDYAISETLFHWQSQNRTSPESAVGASYINQEHNQKEILLFIRESPQNEYKSTQGYVFIGPARYISHEGSQPMSIKWELHEPIPNYLWKESAKMVSG